MNRKGDEENVLGFDKGTTKEGAPLGSPFCPSRCLRMHLDHDGEIVQQAG
jgi:hypothetical protein